MVTFLTILTFWWFFCKSAKIDRKIKKGKKLSKFEQFLDAPCPGVLDPPSPTSFNIKIKGTIK